MADQKNDETKTPFARRGARPFGGPPHSSAPNRPFIRPAAPQRPTAAPFVAPVAPGKLVLRNAGPAPVTKTPTPVAPPTIPSADVATPVSTRPVTGEIGVLDAIDAFDAAWKMSEAPGRPVEPGPVAPPLDELSLGSGTDGQALCAEDITAEDITAEDISSGESETVATPITLESNDAAASTMPAWLEDDVAPPAEPTRAPLEPENTPVATDVPSMPTVAPPVSDVSGGYGFGEWTDSHMIPAFDEIMGVLPEQPVAPVLESLGEALPAQSGGTGDEAPASPEPSPRFELVDVNQEPRPEVDRDDPQPAVVVAVPAAEAYSPHEARIAATFDRLADRVRSGEIDVSSIAPEATDAAVLASVLAALLGGSRSR